MPNFTSTVKIENFKSIRSMELNDCKRINLFIGRPNVGKSNILEAISLFSIPYFYRYDKKKSLNSIVRFEQLSELFFDGDKNRIININFGEKTIAIFEVLKLLHFSSKNEENKYGFNFVIKDTNNIELEDNAEQVKEKSFNTLFSEQKFRNKSYLFPPQKDFSVKYPYDELLPFYGKNLFSVVQNLPSLKDEAIELFSEYNLNLVFDKASQEFKIMKGIEKGEIFLIPFSSVADSLQRLIFFKAAIKSNKDSIITFEEPEAHTYPPYIAQIAQDIIEAKTNQFFITTHSPYVVSELLANAQDELAIFMVDFKEGETVANRLTDEQLQEVYDDGIDLFFNNELFK